MPVFLFCLLIDKHFYSASLPLCLLLRWKKAASLLACVISRLAHLPASSLFSSDHTGLDLVQLFTFTVCPVLWIQSVFLRCWDRRCFCFLFLPHRSPESFPYLKSLFPDGQPSCSQSACSDFPSGRVKPRSLDEAGQVKGLYIGFVKYEA